MTPLSSHVIITPLSEKRMMGVKLPVKEGLVKKVSSSVDILKDGDTVAYIAGKEKWQDGECILNVEHIQAII